MKKAVNCRLIRVYIMSALLAVGLCIPRIEAASPSRQADTPVPGTGVHLGNRYDGE
jgi:hypothetical protein